MKYTPDEIMNLCMVALPNARTLKDHCNIRIAGRFAWQEKEMGGIEHVQFAYRNNTPIVPPGHCGHPVELVKRGFVDGKGWKAKDPIELFKWPDGNHWYATVDGIDVQDEDGNVKWNTREDAIRAAKAAVKN